MIPIAKPIITECEKHKVLEVLNSGILASGNRVRELEAQFSKYVGCRYGIATSSGTTALCTALKSLGIKNGDLVLTTPFSFISTANSILYCNAKPVFADIDEKTFNIDPEQIEKVVEENDKIKALLIVHLYGLACDMKKIMKIVRDYQLKLIEDCAQAHGAEYKGKRVGSFGNVSCFSFYPTKNITTGEGGMILTDDEEIYERCKGFINHGMRERYFHESLGYNYRLTDLQAAMGICQLKNLEKFNGERIQNARHLSENFRDMNWLETPYIPKDCKHVFNQYTVKIKEDRDSFINYLSDNGIGYGIYYPMPIYKQSLYTGLGYKDKLPVAEKIAEEVISLPVHPNLTEEDLNFICRIVTEYGKRVVG